MCLQLKLKPVLYTRVKMMNKVLPIIGAVAVAAGLVYYHPVFSTNVVVKRQARLMCHTGMEAPTRPDWWGYKLHSEVEVIKGTKFCVVTSRGRDHAFGTDDDIWHRSTNLNKTRLLGEYIGKRSDELVKGLLDGIIKGGEQ